MQSKLMRMAQHLVAKHRDTINVAALSKKLGVTYDWLYRLKQNKANDSASNLEAFINHFGYDVEFKINDDQSAGTIALKNNMVDLETSVSD